ncbi:DUF885 domain-containing protein [Microlunatus ginsengisoli]|uniref:DUF885 domain-containing protein n=1 Tax=Microlunatus ginsengisoli TaxID=363863 RepID=A0ABP6ZJV5_9ACTN
MTRPVDEVADAYVAESVERYPEVATSLGAPGHDHEWSDYSPAGVAAELEHLRGTVAALAAAIPSDDREQIAKEAMLERLALQVELHEAHIPASRVSSVAGAVQGLVNTIDLMPDGTAQAWEAIVERVRTLGRPLTEIAETLQREADQGHVSARRQILATVDQVGGWIGGDDDYFAALADRIPTELRDGVVDQLTEVSASARESLGRFADWLRSELAPRGREVDAVGREQYELESRYFLGAVVDLDETYQWGFAELHRLQTEQHAIARELFGDPDIPAACAGLDADPARQITGAAAFRDWMQQLADRVIAELNGVHFDIPAEIATIECCIAPTHDGGVYYTGPTEDFSRPGRMWWSVPAGIDRFSTWKETTTVFHEGVPGHHLQVGQNAVQSELLNRWQRQLAFVSGHGEGWALYAERLMDDLGYLADPADRMGMLDAQAFRAARVVIDIGMHLQLEIPADNPMGFHPGERWTPELGYDFMRASTAIDEPTLRFEIDRYLGWPGQAPSYKVGERIWLEARDAVRARQGAEFDLRRFHADALNLGSLGLDPLRAALDRL